MRTPVVLSRLWHRISINDFLILAVLLFLCVDLRRTAFDACRKPIHMWLFGTYFLLLAFRVAALCLPAAAPREQELDLILPLKHIGPWALPLLFAWNALGSHWLYSIRSHPHLGEVAGGCLADTRKYAFVLSWQVAIYAVVFIHCYIYILSRCKAKRMQTLLDNLRALEDEDLLRRWGPQRPDELSKSERGLSPNEILDLPSQQAPVALADQESDCSICLSCVHTGDSVRSLDKCGHTFHRACIDLWLLRRASCPLCKTPVGGDQLAVSARSCLV